VGVIAVSRQVQTLLFTDIVGSTARLRELGDPAWAALLARHQDVIRAVLAAHRGREVDTTGDGFLARFDAPAPAVRAAATSVAAVAALGLELRAGLHCGEVELNGNRISGVGVHLAVRVMAEAGPGQVLVSSTVRELLAGSGIGFVDLGARQLKGFPDRWRLFALDLATVPDDQTQPLGWEPMAQGRGRSGGSSPGLVSVSPTLVGRVEELQLLTAAKARAAGGEPAVVLVGGEAGVGKTRLVAELTADPAANGARMLVGGCVPVGEGALPYAPIVAVLRMLLTDLGAEAVRGLTGPSWAELARLAPGLGQPQRDPAGEAAQSRLFELLLGLLGRLAQQAPLVLVVEDLHWADHSTRDLLAFLVRNLRRERVLLVVTYRSDEPGQQRLGPYLAELDRGGPVQRLELPRLDRAQTTAQLIGILGAAPAAELVEAVFARSEGNPFYTEELLAAVRAGSSELPATLRDLLRGRMIGLSELARQVLEVVAMAGRQAPHRLVAAVADLDDQQLDGALRAAVASQLLVTGEDGYDVRHAVLREVIETDLLPGERARLHAGLARALADQPEVAGVAPAVAAAELAVHWDAAGEAAEALPARVRAGQAAERAHALHEARSQYERALQLWAQVPTPGRPAGLDEVDLLHRAAEAAGFTGAVQRAIELLEHALDRLDPAAEPVRTAVLLARLGDHHRLAGNETDALAAYQEAERLLATTPPSTERARVLASHARTLTLLWRGAEAIPRCEEAIAIAQAVGARAEEAHALSTLGMCLDDFGELDRSIRLQRQARQIAEEVGDAEGIVRTYVNLNHALSGAGHELDALEDARKGYQRARQLGLEHSVGSAVAGNLAWSLLSTGRWEDCERLTEELIATATWTAFAIHACRGLLLTRRGNFVTARDHLEQSMRLSPPASRDAAWPGLAELAIWEGRDNQAQQVLSHWRRWWTEIDPNQSFPQLSLPWYGLILRLEADRAARPTVRRSPSDTAKARSRAASVAAELDRLAASHTPQVRSPHAICDLLVAQAELSRLQGPSSPARWQAAATAWNKLEHRFEAAYARFRLAEALLAIGGSHRQAQAAVRSAHDSAVALGAAPLRREIELLAQRGRLHLKGLVGLTAASTAQSPPVARPGARTGRSKLSH
jgi:class 3 adenylate cyclase/tetratricopeptide (TPR) repeat protein